MPDALNPPVFIGGHWVLATLEDAAGGFVRCHASIAVGEAEVLDAAAVDVQVFIGETHLGLVEEPPDGPLPTVTISGTTAYAQYVFENPSDLRPDQITVTLGGETASFDVSFPIV
jgi:hypothetical protein